MRYFELKECRYNKEDEAEVLVLPYKDNQYKFVIFLASEGVKFEDFRTSLTGEILTRLQMNAIRSCVNVTIPKFKLTYEPQMKQLLQQLGVSQLFTENCDLKEVSNVGNLYVDDIIHKAVVEVNEEGTEAAAVTGMTMRLTSIPMDTVDFRADRPFVFGIFYDDEPIFLGQYC
ncbi:unnamed protein product [Strongylus vulgaris]|uniref:Serpin domain-containing protein n=1 Tax=Strongylus vulgaris TaxID=40348 RepID=A0A3P7JD81_STRVU|nr:unnamed protein product [Strongylus vulgaris]